MTHALFAAADALLLLAIAARISGRASAGLAAALLLLVTPAHVLGVAAPSAGYQAVPFVLGWALGLTALNDRPTRRARGMAAAGVASLLASAAAYPPAALLVPVLGA